jgi:hypothetical protein
LVGFIILFRRSAAASPFREFLKALLRWRRCDQIAIASGYFWEDNNSPACYKVSQDDVLASLAQGRHDSVVTVAGKFGRGWPNYRAFYGNFVGALRAGGVNVAPFVSAHGRWHAKVAVGLRDGTPQAMIRGSSNLTGPAYGINRTNFNNEADVVLWSSLTVQRYFLRVLEAVRANLAPEDFLVGGANPDFPQPTDRQRMQTITRDLLDGLLEFNE